MKLTDYEKALVRIAVHDALIEFVYKPDRMTIHRKDFHKLSGKVTARVAENLTLSTPKKKK